MSVSTVLRFGLILPWLIVPAGCASLSDDLDATNTVAAGTDVLPAGLREAPAANPDPQSVDRAPQAYAGQRVLWGGTIVAADNAPPVTRIELAARPLDKHRRPLTEAPARGRFVAELDAPFDPELYSDGRPLTVAGKLRGEPSADGTPVVAVEDYYLWDPSPAADRPLPVPRRPRYVYYPHYYSGRWWHPYGFYSSDYGFGGGLRLYPGLGLHYGRGGHYGFSIGF